MEMLCRNCKSLASPFSGDPFTRDHRSPIVRPLSDLCRNSDHHFSFVLLGVTASTSPGHPTEGIWLCHQGHRSSQGHIERQVHCSWPCCNFKICVFYYVICRSQLALIESMIFEMLRLMSHAPIAVPHKTMDDTELLGHRIPKGTQVHNIIAPNLLWVSGRLACQPGPGFSLVA